MSGGSLCRADTPGAVFASHGGVFPSKEAAFQREDSITATLAMPVHQEGVDGDPARDKVRSFGLGLVGTLAVLTAAWGGIVPYIGPVFGYSGDGSGSWR